MTEVQNFFEENDRSTKLFGANTVLAYGSNLFECLHTLAELVHQQITQWVKLRGMYVDPDRLVLTMS